MKNIGLVLIAALVLGLGLGLFFTTIFGVVPVYNQLEADLTATAQAATATPPFTPAIYAETPSTPSDPGYTVDANGVMTVTIATPTTMYPYEPFPAETYTLTEDTAVGVCKPTDYPPTCTGVAILPAGTTVLAHGCYGSLISGAAVGADGTNYVMVLPQCQ